MILMKFDKYVNFNKLYRISDHQEESHRGNKN